MNRFYNYDSPGAAEIYDKSRHAMGADVIAGLMYVRCKKPLKVTTNIYSDNDINSVLVLFLYILYMFFSDCILLIFSTDCITVS